MTPEQREELRAAAEKIIDDGWYEERDKGMAIDACASDYDFIFKANPSAILSLIAQVEALTVPQIVAFGCTLIGHASTTDGMDDKEATAWVSQQWEEWSSPTIPAIPGTKEGA